MRRFARERRVFFWEEHIPCDHPLPFLEHHPFPADGVIALRPRLRNRITGGTLVGAACGLALAHERG